MKDFVDIKKNPNIAFLGLAIAFFAVYFTNYDATWIALSVVFFALSITSYTKPPKDK
jgi:hypothetical protein